MVELKEGMENDDDFSDLEGDEDHASLLAAIAKLDKRKRVQPSARREPSLQVSEFHLIKDGDIDSNTVHLRDLAKTLNQRASHSDIARKLKNVQRKSQTLPKPLEKPEANRIQREVGYGNVKKQLSEWDPIVFRNRVAEDLVFPLNAAKITTITPSEFLSAEQNVTSLEKEIAAVLNDSPSVQQERNEQEEFPLSLEEMIQRRKELARLRAQESYRQAKAHRQNKIKSKKYHRIARREKIRQQLKEFEVLQQKDPEAALERLEELGKERAQERVSLRHRSTGHWARNQAVRAKYDKESRQVLAEQLRLSKDLTQKVQLDSDSGDDEEDDATTSMVESSGNPWVTTQKKSESEIENFISGYRKFWDEKEKEKREKEVEDHGEKKEGLSSEGIAGKESDEVADAQKRDAFLKSAVVSYSEIANTVSPSPKTETPKKTPQKTPKKTPRETSGHSTPLSEKSILEHGIEKTETRKKGQIATASGRWIVTPGKKGSKPKTDSSIKTVEIISASGKWIVTPDKKGGKKEPQLNNSKMPVVKSNEPTDLDEIFGEYKEKLVKGVEHRIAKLKKEEGITKKNKVAGAKRVTEAEEKNKLEMKRQRVRPDVDEELHEHAGSDSNAVESNTPPTDFLSLTSKSASQAKDKSAQPEIDPNKFIKTAPVWLRTQLPDNILGADGALDDSEDEETSKQLTISEAFADDDVIADFSKEKEETVQKSKPEDIDLTLPGWGEWGGHKIQPNKRKRKRFIVKMPEAPPRRDANKGNLIISEDADASAKPHQVNDLPFPFTSVRDFEASVRAPVSNTFIPESAHRKLIKPAVRTKMGTIINPMDKEVLINRQKK